MATPGYDDVSAWEQLAWLQTGLRPQQHLDMMACCLGPDGVVVKRVELASFLSLTS